MNVDANSDAIESVSRVLYYGISDTQKREEKKNESDENRLGRVQTQSHAIFGYDLKKYVCVSHLHGT